MGDGAVDNKGGVQGKPGRRGDGNPPQESGAEGDRRKKGGGAGREVGIMRKTGVKDGVRTGCEKRKILTSPSPYPFLMSNQS